MPISRLSLYLLLLCALCSSTLGWDLSSDAQQPGRNKPLPSLTGLNLTDEQREQVRDILASAREDVNADKQRLRQIREEIHRQLQADSPNRGTLDSLTREFYGLKQEQKMTEFDAQIELAKILTPEQRQKLQGMAKNKRQRMHNKRGAGKDGERLMHRRRPDFASGGDPDFEDNADL